MATLSIPFSFQDGNTIVASQHNSNFNAVKSFVDALSAGTNFDANAIGTSSIDDLAITNGKIAGNAVTLDKIATALQQALCPTGSILPYAGSTSPSGWLVCDGSQVSRTEYPALFALVGTTYGSGNGSTTFNVPNLIGRVPVGRDAGQTEFDVLGETGGAKTVTLTAAQSGLRDHGHSATTTVVTTVTINDGGAHSHGYDNTHDHLVDSTQTASTSHTHTGTQTNAAGISGGTQVDIDTQNTAGSTISSAGTHAHTNTATSTASTGIVASGSANASEAHTNLQPYLVLNYIIKAA
jgi:microcystin-dependent protein